MAPAAVTESPSPMTTEELLSGMVTEEVEPGVFRVVNDGVRDLSYPLGGWGCPGFMVDVTPDGSVWLSVDVGRARPVPPRRGTGVRGPRRLLSHREVAPDGSLWASASVSDDRRGIFSFDGEGWTVRATTTDALPALAVGPDGTVWVVAIDEDKHCPDIEDDDCSGTVLLRLEDDGSLTTIEDWSDVYDGDATRSNWRCHPTATYGSSAPHPLGPSCCCASMARDGKPSRVPRDGTPARPAGTSTSVRTARCG